MLAYQDWYCQETLEVLFPQKIFSQPYTSPYALPYTLTSVLYVCHIVLKVCVCVCVCVLCHLTQDPEEQT
jgi:hypothetical protein